MQWRTFELVAIALVAVGFVVYRLIDGGIRVWDVGMLVILACTAWATASGSVCCSVPRWARRR
jgi:hypothetical protein